MLTKRENQLKTKWYYTSSPLTYLNLQSKLTIAGEKGKTVLGEADLNLSEYEEGVFKVFKLSLKKCKDDDAYIEVGLRATESKVDNRNT